MTHRRVPPTLVATVAIWALVSGTPQADAQPIPPCDPSTPNGFLQCYGGGWDGQPWPYQARDCYGRHPVDYETACGPTDWLYPPGQ